MLTNTQRNQNILIYSLILISIFINGCKDVSDTKQHSDADGAAIRISRFEKELFDIDQAHLNTALDSLHASYPGFYELYFEQIMGFGSTKNEAYKIIVRDFITNKDLRTLYHDTDSIYADLSDIESATGNMFERYKKIFPEDTIPKVVSFISGFNNGIVTTHGYVGIGLDLFLGEDYKYYPSVGFPQYMIRRLTKAHLLPMLAKGIANAKYESDNLNSSFLERIIQEGKLLYFVDQVLPDTPDSLKIGYTKQQLAWCKTNEENIWGLFLEGDLLFSTDQLKYRKYTEEAPFTAGLANDSSPRIGIWTGWQIVKKYMKENPSVTLQQLMEEKDFQKILKGSKYRP